jgi:hypothetical protein
MKQFELTVMALVKRKVVVSISEDRYEQVCDDDLTPQENAKMLYEDDKFYFFDDIEEINDCEEIMHEEILGVEELPKEQYEN